MEWSVKVWWRGCRALLVALFALLLAGSATAQQEAPAAEPWQEVITAQIEAFRAGDAAAAFGYAGAGFHKIFRDPQTFLDAVLNTGYSAIAESRSHSFGSFRLLGSRAVVQEVRLVGKDQVLYRAFYELIEESGGWRVLGVQLLRQGGIGI